MKTLLTLSLIFASIGLLSACDSSNEEHRQLTLDIQQQLHELHAESEIRRKLQEYMELLTAADWDNYIEYFSVDGKIIMTEGTVVGRDAIKERMANATARMASNRGDQAAPKRRDLLSNILIDVTGNTAIAESRFTFIQQNAEGIFEIVGSGLYLDEWKLENGEWLIAAREVDYDMLRSAPQP